MNRTPNGVVSFALVGLLLLQPKLINLVIKKNKLLVKMNNKLNSAVKI